eukprot:tig00000498_g1670.t1
MASTTYHACDSSRLSTSRRPSRDGALTALLRSLDINSTKSACGASSSRESERHHRPILQEHNNRPCQLQLPSATRGNRPLSAPPTVDQPPVVSPKASKAVELVSPSDNSPALRAAVQAAAESLSTGKNAPELCAEGLSGSYFLRDVAGKVVGVFKPQDEEGAKPGTQVEHSVFFASTWRKGIPKGQGCMRERAAYVLDHGSFAGVPATGLRIGLLDLRILNVDRHAGNILWNAKTKQLIPIDHGLCLPEYPHLDDIWFCWLGWPQSKEPFGPEEIAYAQSLDADRDVELASKELNFPASTLLTLRIGTMLTKKGVAAGLTLYELGQIVCSTNDDSESELQRLCAAAEKAGGEPGSPFFMEALEAELDRAFAAVIASRK